MRIYEGSPRQDFEEVFRSIGAFLDQRGMREILLVEAPDGFIVQGLVRPAAARRMVRVDRAQAKETLTFLDDDIAGSWRRPSPGAAREPAPPGHEAGYYETAFRVLGRYMDEQKPRDVFFFEQDGAFVVRLLMAGQQGSHHDWPSSPGRTSRARRRGPALRHARQTRCRRRHPRPDATDQGGAP